MLRPAAAWRSRVCMRVRASARARPRPLRRRSAVAPRPRNTAPHRGPLDLRSIPGRPGERPLQGVFRCLTAGGVLNSPKMCSKVAPCSRKRTTFVPSWGQPTPRRPSQWNRDILTTSAQPNTITVGAEAITWTLPTPLRTGTRWKERVVSNGAS